MTTSGWVSSGISGPIPSHALYQANEDLDNQARSARIRRIAAAADAAAAAATASALPWGRAGSPPPAVSDGSRDYVRENIRRLRSNSAHARSRRGSSSGADTPTLAADSSREQREAKFSHVAPRVYTDVPERYRYRPDSATGSRPNSGAYLRAHEKTGPDPLLDDHSVPAFPRTAPEHKLTVHKAGRPPRPPPTPPVSSNIDFVRANANAAGRPTSASASSRSRLGGANSQLSSAAPPDSYRRGELPDYLLKRRQMWSEARAAELASQPDPEQPQGHRRLDEAERQKTLGLLRDAQAQLLSEVNRLPITADTLRARQRRNELERQLAELDEAVRVFSRPKVFVRLDQ